MQETQQPVDFDTRPPLPVNEYREMVRRVNPGYDLVFVLVESFLRALGRPNLNLLVVGAGGGAEIELLMPGNPGWRITGLDPSREMIAQARAATERAGVSERVRLMLGQVQDLPDDARFGAATCLYVLHFLPDDQKLALIRETRRRPESGAPLIVVTGVSPGPQGLSDFFRAAWQQHGELMGIPPERMAQIVATVAEQVSRPGATTADGYVRLLREAGFMHVDNFFSVIGGIYGWIAR